MSKLENEIISVISDAMTVGITSKQIAATISEKPEVVSRHIKTLMNRNKVIRIGRGLWILKKYEKMEKDPEFIGPEQYKRKFVKECGVPVTKYLGGKITFTENTVMGKQIQRWSPYVQGFSASFVDQMLNRYEISEDQTVLDPFVGSGTVLVCAKMRGIDSIGVDLMPLMTFMSKVKTDWNIDVNEVKRTLENLDWNQPPRIHPPTFLREWKSHFRQTVLRNLLILKQSILSVKNPKIRDLFRLALVSILVDCSNLKRSPCLGYVKDKDVPDDAPFKYFAKKVEQIIDDLKYVQGKKQGKITIITGDARTVTYEPGSVNIAITSPPYVNGLDYIINYKIEMAWLDMVNSYEDLRQLKNEMVACDNISRNIIRDFSEKSHTYTNNWIEEVTKLISRKIAQKKGYRREDMHLVVRKYFDDIHPVLGNVYDGLEEGGRFIIVIGDSLMAGVYIPADLIIAKMGKDVGFEIEGVEVARQRRSGQRRSFRLRESIVVLRKGKRKRMGLEGYIYPR